MSVKREREIVIELESIKITRKRARTRLAYCCECEHEADYLGIAEATEIFETAIDELLSFIVETGCHQVLDDHGHTQVCLNSLLSRFRTKLQYPNLTIRGELQ